ncbi:hypothetical protein AD428_00430 [Achromobacter sp. DMS1]|uniref:DUF6511 domain-containing protein n=1 Tax=Achromobacter sp. DMS1 TaxID=1688405 RepID=UPI00069E1AB2|nr:DUF6511 domain-containing protein [Achromobacter sp. DMS1]KOF54980.1 hypothetical protein AD428_03645 [Achromobacter sp. DMS1]KOF55463.1 hypothetical protein AD428_00430 [Achromobacter sp. DMS1]
MKCWVCKRQARGYGHTDNRHGVGDPRRYPLDWVFCSRRCQDAFHALYGNWQRAKEGRIDKTEVAMINPSDVERAAMRQCLKAFGGAAGEIGFDKPLGDYSESEALRVIDAIVTCWSEAMVSHHEATKFPPVRGLPATPDPLAPEAANPFADFNDDIPF